MEIEERVGPPRGLLLGLGIMGLVIGGALAGEFVFRLQPSLGGTVTAASGTVVMPLGVGSNQGLNFVPATTTVIVGFNNTVTFKNEDSSAPFHTVTATDHSFDSGNLANGQSWTHEFTAPGTYTYYCIYHPWMRGTVVVLPAGSAPSAST